MSASKISRAWSVGCCLTLTLGLAVLFAPLPAHAQGEPAQPTCYACHTWDDPVVEQGEWHTIHALQKNCCACHGGNDRASDQAAAHAGMTPNPLDNPQLSCQHCHPDDYRRRAEAVVVALGITPGDPEPTARPPFAASTPTPMIVTLLPQAPLRGWDWPVELAVAIVVVGLGVMRWKRVHSR